jgi:D-alanyl-D-alanine carboxypeptidase/D-alanyl-D-alanine-endopeptidase (penicillin-binding protein 4)
MVPRSVTTAAMALLFRLCAALCAALAAAPVQVQAQVPAPVADALRDAGLSPDAMAFMAVPPGRGAVPIAHQPDRAMAPGSTMKLVTSVVALDRLGPGHRGHTELLASRTPQGPVFTGELFLRGGADPELGLPQLWALLAELRWRGVQHLAGDIVLDRTLFRPTRMDRGVPPFDEAPEFPYNVIPDALQLAGSLMGLELRADGTAVQVTPMPPLDRITIDNRLTLDERDCRRWDDEAAWKTPAAAVDATGAWTLTLHGSFPRHCTQRAELQLLDRDAQAERQLRLVWQGLGGTWSGRVREGAAAADAVPVARRESRPLGDLLRRVNKQSDNVTTRLLYLSLGVPGMAAEPAATTAALAARVVRQWFGEHRIATDGLVLDNGSGLSRTERITPRQLVGVLSAAQDGPHLVDLMASLPVAGVDGTMRNRLKSGAATGRARLKTGTLRNATALAGYVPDAQGRWWMVAAMVDLEPAGPPQARMPEGGARSVPGVPAAAGRAALDALVEWIARQDASPAGTPSGRSAPDAAPP